MLAKGQTILDACKQLGGSEQTYYRCRKEYGGMKADQAKRLKEPDAENARFKRAVADPHGAKKMVGPEGLEPSTNRL